MKTYDEIKEHLLTRHAEILQRVQQIEQDVRRKDGPLELDLDDQSISLENNDVLDKLNKVEREELDKIFAALTRLETGQYGRCDTCNQLISERRLEALPFTLVCIECAKDDDPTQRRFH